MSGNIRRMEEPMSEDEDETHSGDVDREGIDDDNMAIVDEDCGGVDENTDPAVARSRLRGGRGRISDNWTDHPPASPAISTLSGVSKGSEVNSRTSSSRRGVKRTVSYREDDREGMTDSPTPSTSSASTNMSSCSGGPKKKGKGKGPSSAGKRGKGRPAKGNNNKPDLPDDIPEEEDGGPPAEGEEEYIVECIVGRKYIRTEDGKKLHYHIKWKNWPSSNNTWEPEENLEGCQELVDRYETARAVRDAQGEASDSSDESGEDLPGGDKENAGTGKSAAQSYLTKKKRQLQYLGVEKRWPVHLIPLEVVGVIHVNKSLCYVVKHQTPKEHKGLSSSNCVLVRASTFRYLYPHVVIEYYQRCLNWIIPTASGSETKIYTKVKLEKSEDENEENADDGNDETPKISIKKGEDLFTSEIPTSNGDENQDDLFIKIKKKRHSIAH